ncbi:hypothetical protein [Agrococcus jejuensis]|uniref:Uncharacterized protein n=1 Tax=Agrococcus jejuensis TaxID=399736 RepID=A0A1G8CWE9_9MICO|nr:hypothetical protein [Agrococcus jejuensis]SDH49479.1 hypothetical protein SAMN04489720_1424 [Agrococcus jejuensis]
MTQRVLDPVSTAIGAYLQPAVAERWLALVAADTRRAHGRLVGMLSHLDAFLPGRAHRVTGSEDVGALLRELGDPQRFAALSDSPALDGRVIDVDELLQHAHVGTGILAAAVDGSLAVWMGEGRDGVVVLR